jgi:hypothetical protein
MIRKEVVVDQFKILSQHLPVETEENYAKAPVNITGLARPRFKLGTSRIAGLLSA